MSAKTKWWLCGVCGHRNHPRGLLANSLNTLAAGEVADNDRCEGCGGDRSDENAVDYQPQGG